MKMLRRKTLKYQNKFFSFIIATIFLSGCGDHTDQTLSPPKDAHWVTVKFKVPEGVTLQPMQVMYRSESCNDTSKNSSGESYDIKGINGFKQDFTQQEQSDIWQTKIAIEGGGSCHWMLNSIKVSFRINETNSLSKDRTNLSTNYIFDFDDDGFSDGYGTGPARDAKGDLDIKTDYFPLLTTNDLLKKKYIELFGGDVRLKQFGRRFNVEKINQIFIAPSVYMNKAVKLSSIAGKSSGMEITYPDGSVGPINETKPDYDKLLSMK